MALMVGVDKVAMSINAKAAKMNTDNMVAGRNMVPVVVRARQVGGQRPQDAAKEWGVSLSKVRLGE